MNDLIENVWGHNIDFNSCHQLNLNTKVIRNLSR